MVTFNKFVCSNKGIFWLTVLKRDFWHADAIIEVPRLDGKRTVVFRKTFFAPFAATLTTLSMRLAEAFTV